MATKSDGTVYCDIQLPLATGRELLRLVTALRESEAHPGLDTVFQHIQSELELSIDLAENPRDWSILKATKPLTRQQSAPSRWKSGLTLR